MHVNCTNKAIDQELTISELVSLAFLELGMSYTKIPRRAMAKICTLVNTVSKTIAGQDGTPPKVFDKRTTIRRLRHRTGIQMRRFDCCCDSCMCFTGQHGDLTHCLICKQARWKEMDTSHTDPNKLQKKTD